MHRARIGALALLLLVAGSVPVACSGGVVGGECRAGFEVCNGHCVDTLSDANNCGGCGHACASSIACVNGICGATGAGNDASADGANGRRADGAAGHANSTGDASLDGEAPSNDANGDDASRGSKGGGAGKGGAPNSGGETSSGGSNADAGPQCIPPFDTAEHCGTCNTSCPPEAPLCSPQGDGYFCIPRCVAPLVPCGTQCVNLDSDENNCGRCGHRCVSGICQGGQCVGATAGNESLFCMDYRAGAAVGTAPEQLLANAVFLGPRSSVRVLGYSEYALPAVTTAVGKTLDAAAANRGRSYVVTAALSSSDVYSLLDVTSFDVLLVYDEPSAPAGRLAIVGAEIADAVDAFVRAGGGVVVLAGDTGRGEMTDFVTAAGLLTVTGQESVTGSTLYNRGLADAVGANAVSPFRAGRETCRFLTASTSDASNVFVVTDSPPSSGVLGAPVVVHRVIAP